MNPSERIDQLIAGIEDWRGKTLADLRQAILDADPHIVEEWKWMGSPTWYCDGIIAVANAHKEKVKITFAHGAKLPDPDKIFNNGLGGKVWRAIDFLEGDKINKRAVKNLIRAAIEFNQSKSKKTVTKKAVGKAAKPAKKTATKKAAARTRAPAKRTKSSKV
jgi:hypothetical protein